MSFINGAIQGRDWNLFLSEEIMPVVSSKVFTQQLGHTPRAREAMINPAPPTVTYSALADLNVSALIPSAQPWLVGVQYNVATGICGGSFSLFRCANPQVLSTSIFPQYYFFTFRSVTNIVTPVVADATISFNHSGSRFVYVCYGRIGSLLFKVNDKFVSLAPNIVPNDGSLSAYFVQFASRETRRIDIVHSNCNFGGVFTDSQDTVQPVARRGRKLICVGDSYTEGTGVGNDLQSWIVVHGERMGFDDVTASGLGGLGYLAHGAQLTTYERLFTDVFPYMPDEVMFALGYNDYNFFSAAEIGAEAARCFNAVRQNLPHAALTVISPWWVSGAATQPLALLAARDAIKAACLSLGGKFLDLLEIPLSASAVPSSFTVANLLAAGSSTVILNAGSTVPVPGTTFKFPDGTKFRVRILAGPSGGPYTITTDAPVQTAQIVGAAVVQCGEALWSGTGRVGATTGYGNCDVLISPDGVHPSPEGHIAIGTATADQLCTYG